MLQKLERKYGRFAVPNITPFLLLTHAFFFLVGLAKPDVVQEMYLYPDRVLHGDVWQLVTFLFIPPVLDPHAWQSGFAILFYIFWIQLYWLFGTALEQHWGAFRYNVFLGVGYVASVGAAFVAWAITGGGAADAGFLFGSIFLAFAFLYPDFVIYIMFIIPVKVKYLAAITWVLYVVAFVMGDWITRMLVLSSVLNFLLFFGRDVAHLIGRGRRAMVRQARQTTARDEPFHRCVLCGRTDKSDPKLEFRYCNKCAGAPCYCIEHVKNHEHKV